MICNRTETGWEIIYQRAHALLAAQLIVYWKPEERPDRWMATLSATAEHDNGWQEWEPGQRLTALHIPRDFSETPAADLVAQSERALRRAWHQSLWSGLLVSHHISRLYEPMRGTHKPLDALLDRQPDQRATWRRALGVKKDDVERAYALLWWADTFSLVLCQHKLPEDSRGLEIGDGPDGTTYIARRGTDEVVTVEPWPYACDAFDAELDTHHLEQLTFENDDDLADALEAATADTRRWRFERRDA